MANYEDRYQAKCEALLWFMECCLRQNCIWLILILFVDFCVIFLILFGYVLPLFVFLAYFHSYSHLLFSFACLCCLSLPFCVFSFRSYRSLSFFYFLSYPWRILFLFTFHCLCILPFHLCLHSWSFSFKITWCIAAWYDALRHGMMHCGMVWCIAVLAPNSNLPTNTWTNWPSLLVVFVVGVGLFCFMRRSCLETTNR